MVTQLFAEQTSVTSKLFSVKSQVLDNGLHVISHSRRLSDTLTLQLIVDIGLRDFKCDDQQAPHVLEHMLFEETQRYAEETMRKKSHRLGGFWKGMTVKEYTHFTINIHSDYMPDAFDILYSIIAEPKLSNRTLNNSIRTVNAERGTGFSKIYNTPGKSDNKK